MIVIRPSEAEGLAKAETEFGLRFAAAALLLRLGLWAGPPGSGLSQPLDRAPPLALGFLPFFFFATALIQSISARLDG